MSLLQHLDPILTVCDEGANIRDWGNFQGVKCCHESVRTNLDCPAPENNKNEKTRWACGAACNLSRSDRGSHGKLGM